MGGLRPGRRRAQSMHARVRIAKRPLTTSLARVHPGCSVLIRTQVAGHPARRACTCRHECAGRVQAPQPLPGISVSEGVAVDRSTGWCVPDETTAYLWWLTGRCRRDRDRLGTSIPSLAEGSGPHEIRHRRPTVLRYPPQSFLFCLRDPHRDHCASCAHDRSLAPAASVGV